MKDRNSEGYKDVTACAAIRQAAQAEQEIEKEFVEVVWLIKKIASLTGFKVVSPVALEHKRTGRVFR